MSKLPAATATEAFLVDFHDRQPGVTPRAFSGVPVQTPSQQAHASSYHALQDALCVALADLPPGHVLDLACGDGHFLDLLADLNRQRIGADASAGELALARARLPAAVELFQSRAQALPLPDASLAAITCHMALMVMSDPEVVLAELARVLTPGGRLLAVLPGPPAIGEAVAPVFRAWQRAVTTCQRIEAWQTVHFETHRWREPSQLSELFAPHFSKLSWTPLRGDLRLSPTQAWRWLTSMYDLHLFAPQDWPALHQRWADHLAPMLEADGLTRIPHALLLVEATASKQDFS